LDCSEIKAPHLPPGAGLSKRDNENIGTVQKPQRASPEAFIRSKQLLLRTKAINDELRLAAERFMLATIELFRGTLAPEADGKQSSCYNAALSKHTALSGQNCKI